MSGFVFFDLETSGLNKAFDQIIQFAAIRTDNRLVEIDRLSIRCRLLPHIVPSPKALLLTGTTPNQLVDTALPSHYEMMMEVRQKLESWTPSTFLGWNSIGFDEAFLQRAFFSTLNRPYLTNTFGNNRMDALTIARAAHYTAPGLLKVLEKYSGQPDFSLASVAAANGFSQHNSHDAEGDVEATLYICKLIKEKVPQAWSEASRFARKDEVIEFLDQNPAIALVSHWDQEHRPPVVFRLGQNADWANEQYLFDLSFDPAELHHCSDIGLEELFRRQNSQLIRMRANAAPIMYYPDDLQSGLLRPPGNVEMFEARADYLKTNSLLTERLVRAADATAWKPVKSEHVELQIYDRFVDNANWPIAEEFHSTEWHKRAETSARLLDSRLRRIAKRLLFFEAPEFMSNRERSAIVGQLKKRVVSAPNDKLWRTIPSALIEARSLLSSMPGNEARLSEITSYIEQIEQRL